MGDNRKTKGHLKRMFKAEYDALKNAIHRCYNENNVSYPNYGGRAKPIRVQDELRTAQGGALLIDAIGPRPGPDYSLDRIDNDGDYTIEPLNLRWTDRTTQQNNRRPPRQKVTDLGWGIGYTQGEAKQGKGPKASPLLPHKGRTQTLIEWSRELGLNGSTIRQRLARGLSVDEALNPSTSRAGLKRAVPTNAFLLPTIH